MEQKRKVPTALAGLLAFAACTGFAHAQSDPTAVEFPMIGVGFNQTFQLNVVSVNPCEVQLAILDSNGTTLRKLIGRLRFQSISITNQVSAFPLRKELQAIVSLQPITTSPCGAQATAEVFDNFTKTAWVLAQGLQPQPPPFMPIYLGPVGLIFEQTARLNVVAFPSGPCKGSIGFIDPSGRAIIEPMEVDLAAGQATFLDLTGLAAGTALGSQRPEVIGVFAPSAPAAPGVCIPSLEIFDRVTGWTRIFLPQPPPNMPAATP
jgi:hypothetical protein